MGRFPLTVFVETMLRVTHEWCHTIGRPDYSHDDRGALIASVATA